MTRFYPYSLVFILLLSVIYFYVWPALPYAFVELQSWQRTLTKTISQLLSMAKEDPFQAFIYVSAASISYGFLHAIGPGHGKVIMMSYLSTHPTKVKTSLLLSISAALLQALVAICLVNTLLFVLETSMREVNAKASYLIDASFVATVLLGLHLAWKSIQDFNKQRKHAQNHGCGCGHKHHARPEELEQAKSTKDYLGIVFSIGIRPCSGALLVLIFAKTLDLYWLGVISAIAMGLGTGAAIALLAFVSLKGGRWLRAFIKPANPRSQWRELLLKLVAASFICVMGVIMMQGTSLLFSPVL